MAVGCNNVDTSDKVFSNKGLNNKDFGHYMAAGVEPAAM
jgi:hypothetical protein